MSVAPPNSWNLGGLTFDAWLRLNHNSTLTITKHPVETGAAITDHSYANPLRFSFDIGMSDVIVPHSVLNFLTTAAGAAVAITTGVPVPTALPHLFSGPSRSVSAYQTLLNLQLSRQLSPLVTKYGSYQNVLIESIDVYDDWQTQNAMRATINLEQVILVSTSIVAVSATPQATDQTQRGQVSPQPLGDNEAYFQKIFKSGLNRVAQ